MQGDFKGIISNITLGHLLFTDWTMYPLDFGHLLRDPELLASLPRENPSWLRWHRKKSRDLPFLAARLFVGAVPNYPHEDRKDSSSREEEFLPDTFVDPTS